MALYLAIAGAYYFALNSYGPEQATRGALVMAVFVLLSTGAIRCIFRLREDERLFHAAMAGKPPIDGQHSAVLGTLHTVGPGPHLAVQQHVVRVLLLPDLPHREGRGLDGKKGLRLRTGLEWTSAATPALRWSSVPAPERSASAVASWARATSRPG